MRYANWSASKKSPWHIVASGEDADSTKTFCGAQMRRLPQWSQGFAPDAYTSKGRLCRLCALAEQKGRA